MTLFPVTLVLSVIVVVGYPVLAYFLISALDLPKKQRRVAAGFLILFLLGGGVGVQGDIFVNLLTDTPMGRSNFSELENVLFMAMRSAGIAGIVGSLLFIRSRGYRLYAAVLDHDEVAMVGQLKNSVEELILAQTEQEKLILASKGTLAALNAMVATDISAAIRGEAMLGRVASLRNTVEVLSQRLEKAGALDEDSLSLRDWNRQQSKIAADVALIKAEDVEQAVEDA